MLYKTEACSAGSTPSDTIHCLQTFVSMTAAGVFSTLFFQMIWECDIIQPMAADLPESRASSGPLGCPWRRCHMLCPSSWGERGGKTRQVREEIDCRSVAHFVQKREDMTGQGRDCGHFCTETNQQRSGYMTTTVKYARKQTDMSPVIYHRIQTRPH